MKHFLGALVLGLLIVVSATAQDGPKKALTQAERLEAKAETLLDQGKRAEAFNLLAKAADLREKARASTPRKATTVKKTKKAAPIEAGPKKAGPQKTGPLKTGRKKAGTRKPANVAQAHARLDRALAKGDVKAAQAASKALHGARKREKDRLAALEKQFRSLEHQLAELQKLIQH